MIKIGTKWISKKLTGVWDNKPNGTLHSYDYFENEDDTWTYNFTFHIDGCFAPIQLSMEKRIPIDKAIEKAREKFENTTWVKQPQWND